MSKWWHLKAFSAKRDPDARYPHEQDWVTASTIDSKRGLDTVNLMQPQQSAYGVQESFVNVAFVRSSPVYNLLPANFRTFTSLGGSAGVVSREYKVSTGTSVGGYGAIQSFRSLAVEYGQTGLCRFSARFPSPVANTWTGCGLVSVIDELSFGSDGTSFGVWHRYGGEIEVRTFTITAAATGAETATITIDNTAYNVPITAGTAAANAKTIADYLNTNATGYFCEQLSNTFIVSAASDGAKSGTWSFSSTGTATATIVRTTTGVTKTSTHVPLASFSGTIPSNFDPEKGNLYAISYGAGYSNIDFKIFDTSRDNFVLAHTVEIVSVFERPALNNPSLRAGLYSASTGSTTDVSIYCSFISSFAQGTRESTRNSRAYNSNKSIGTTNTNLITLRNKRIYNGLINQAEIEPLLCSIANEGNKSLVVEVRGNPTVAGTTNFENIGTDLIGEVDIAGTTVTQDGSLLASVTIGPASRGDIDFSKLEIRVPPTLRLVISAYQLAGGNAAAVTATLSWQEDI